MHFVAALDRVTEMRCVLGLFEGVVTGAADGYARMTGTPAATLLHLGPGFANGMANLHNASKAHSPIVNIVGDHATYHRVHDAPLTSDVEGIARPYSTWLKTSKSADDVAADGAAAVAAARTPPGGIATLILPGDVAWNDGTGIASPMPVPAPAAVGDDAVATAAALLRAGGPSAILLGGVLHREVLEDAGRIAAATGAKILAPYSMPRAERGAGRVPFTRVPFVLDRALELFAGMRSVILVGATPPVAFFAYPNRPNIHTPPDCVVHTLSSPEEDGAAALRALAERLDASRLMPVTAPRSPVRVATGAITPQGLADVIAAHIPEDAIVVDESQTSGRAFMSATTGSVPHDYITNTGGSIGYGLPVALGAAIAAPGRRVLALIADGSGMYTLQALWSIARENLDVTTVIFANRTYGVLIGEANNVGAGPLGARALDMLEIGRPDLNWVHLAEGMGVPAKRVTDLESLARHLADNLRTPGPSLIEVVVPT
jgi:acetolactate synthase-1/2/3 large subunit